MDIPGRHEFTPDDVDAADFDFLAELRNERPERFQVLHEEDIVRDEKFYLGILIGVPVSATIWLLLYLAVR